MATLSEIQKWLEDRLATDAEPVDPHQPPAGYRFHPRCPIGPLVRPDRELCLTLDPTPEAGIHRHHTACHYAAAALQAVDLVQ